MGSTSVAPVGDLKVSSLISERYFEELRRALSSDAIFVGGGPSGLLGALRLADRGFRVVVVDKRLAPGGGIWGGSMGFNWVVLQRELSSTLSALGVPFEEREEALLVPSLALSSALILRASSHPRISFLNLTSAVDLRVEGDRVAGVVVNFTPIEMASLHVDPMVLCSRAVVDATGHEAVLVNLYARRKPLQLRGEGFMNAELGEGEVVELTRMVAPGLFVCGMAAINLGGGHRMGPIFGGMLLSGERVAELVAAYLEGL